MSYICVGQGILACKTSLVMEIALLYMCIRRLIYAEREGYPGLVSCSPACGGMSARTLVRRMHFVDCRCPTWPLPRE